MTFVLVRSVHHADQWSEDGTDKEGTKKVPGKKEEDGNTGRSSGERDHGEAELQRSPCRISHLLFVVTGSGSNAHGKLEVSAELSRPTEQTASDTRHDLRTVDFTSLLSSDTHERPPALFFNDDFLPHGTRGIVSQFFYLLI